MESLLHCPPALALAIDRAREALLGAHVDQERLACGTEAATIVAALTDDEALALGTLSSQALHGAVADPSIRRVIGERAVRMADALAPLGDLGLPRAWQPDSGLDARQAETLRIQACREP